MEVLISAHQAARAGSVTVSHFHFTHREIEKLELLLSMEIISGQSREDWQEGIYYWN